MAGIIDHESMLTDTGMETVTDSNTTNLLQNIMASSYLTTTTTNSTSTNTTINTQRTLSYPLAQSSTSINPHSHTEMSMHTGMGQRLPGKLTCTHSVQQHHAARPPRTTAGISLQQNILEYILVHSVNCLS